MIRATERATILAALPRLVFERQFSGGVAGVLVEFGDRILDGGVTLTERPEIFLRPLPQNDTRGLAAWLQLLERRRAQLAHDMSGPATGVLAALETVLEYEPIPASSRGLLSDAHTGVLHLTRSLGDRVSMLDASPNIVSGPLTRVIAQIARPLADAIDPHGERLNIRLHGSDVEARIDAAIVEGSLAVLLSNVWRFRRGQEARAVIDASIEEDTLIVSVADAGRGMDAATLERAGELGFTTSSSGVGLGLFLLRRAVSARDGALVMMGTEDGVRATVLLPLNTP